MKRNKRSETDLPLPFPFEGESLVSLNSADTGAKAIPAVLPAATTAAPVYSPAPESVCATVATDNLFEDDPRRTASGAYRQEWTDYNLAKENEPDHLRSLLWHLCQIPQGEEQMRGQPRLALADMLFVAVNQAYFQKFPARTFKSFVKRMKHDGLISKVPHFNSIHNFLKTEWVTDALKEMLIVSSRPFIPLEKHFAADSSGFATYTFSEYRKKKYGDSGKKRRWRSAHIVCGVNTKVVTAIELTDGNEHDTHYLEPLLRQTAQLFSVEKVSADKGYLSDDNFRLIESVGAEGFIKFKDNSKGQNKHLEFFNRAFHRFSCDPEKYLKHYHPRSNVESVFSMLKRNWGEKLRSRNEVGQDNEIIAKFICHNLCCLILAMYKNGVQPTEIFNGDRFPTAPISLDGTH